MTEEHEHLVESLAGYVLESLERPERARVEAHIATCTTCARRLDEYRAVLGALPLGLEPVAPPPAAWAEIRAAARSQRPHWRGWLSFRPGWRRMVTWPALAALIASLVVWNVVLQRGLTRHPRGPEVEALARRPGRLVILAGTGKPGASARLFVAVDGGHGHMAITGLTPLPRERTYQLWFVQTGAAAASGGTFGVDAGGRAWVTVTVPVPLDKVRTITVTEEPAPGSATPQGEHLLDARSWR